MQRWAISLDGEVRRRLTEEQLELGTESTGENGDDLLIFRDRFVALRVARSVEAPLLPLEEPLIATA